MLLDSITINLGSGVQAMLVISAALALEKLIKLPSNVNPLVLYRFICNRMSQKVHKGHDKKQDIIAGSLGYLVLVLPVLLIFYLVHEFASYAWLLDILLLYILLSFRNDAHVLQLSANAIAINKKQLSKNLLQTKVLRQTDTLSALGIYKACEEALLLRYCYQQFCTIFCFLLLGPTAAVGYRLAYEAQQAWNVKLAHYRYFGMFTQFFILFFQFVPKLLFSLSFILFNRPHKMFELLASANYWYAWVNSWRRQYASSFLLKTLSITNKVDAGGPVIYDGTKVKRERFSYDRTQEQHNNSSLTSVKSLINCINRHLILGVFVLTTFLYWMDQH